MAASPDRKRLIAKLHVLKNQAGMSEDDYRSKLELATGKRSAALMTAVELVKALNAFHVKQNTNNKYTGKLRAFFIAAYNLGAITDGSDRALDAFICRQTGKQTIRFLLPAEANSVTEALKAMCARLGFTAPASDLDGRNVREALLKAQWARLAALGAVSNADSWAMETYLARKYLHRSDTLANFTIAQLDDAQRFLGWRIRKAMPDQGREAEAS